MASTDKTPEKRRYPRLLVNMRIQGHWASPGGEQHPLEALLVRISEGGALLRCSEPIPVNSLAEFILPVDLETTLKPHGRVRWWRRNGEVRDIGLEFDPPQRTIGRFVEDELAKERRSGGRR